MAVVAFDSAGPSSSGQGQVGLNITWTHTTVAGGCYILLGICIDNEPLANSVTATCDSIAMLPVRSIDCSSGGAGYLQVFITASAVAAGAHTIACPGFAGQEDMEGGSIAVSGATGYGTAAVAQGTGIIQSVTVPSTASGNLCVGFAAAGGSILSAASPSASQFVINLKGGGGAAGGNAAGATSLSTGSAVTMSWGSSSSGDPWAAIAVEMQGGQSAYGSGTRITGYRTG